MESVTNGHMATVSLKIPCQLDKVDKDKGEFLSIKDARVCNFDTPVAATITARYYKGVGGNHDNMVLTKEQTE